MNTEAEVVLKECLTVKNKADRGVLTQTATRYLRPREIRQRKQEIANIDDNLNDRLNYEGLSSDARRQMALRRVKLEKELEHCAPRDDLKGETKDVLQQKERILRESWLEGIPTQEEMRRNTAGATDKHARWSKSKKSTVLAWRNVMLALHHDADEAFASDMCSIERFRPSGMVDQNGTFSVDAQIPGHFTYHAVPDDSWERVFGNVAAVNSPLARADNPDIELLRQENARIEAKLAALEGRTARAVPTQEELERKRIARANRRAALEKAREAKVRKQQEKLEREQAEADLNKESTNWVETNRSDN